jgi:hypothetical protein
MKYDFTLKIVCKDISYDELEDKFHDSDATLSFQDGKYSLSFTREGASLEEAIESAFNSIDEAGIDIKYIELIT